jgi:hypothetical protein
MTADRVAVEGGVQFSIPVVQKKRPGIDATLILTARTWNS